MAAHLVELLKRQFGARVLLTHAQHGDDTVVVDPSVWLAAARFLRDTPAADMSMLTDLTVVDFPEREPRFEVVAHFYSLAKGHRLRLKTRVGDEDGEGAEVDSLSELWGSANWLEREAWDMFGRSLSRAPRSAPDPDVSRVRGIFRCARTTPRSGRSHSSRIGTCRTSSGCRRSGGRGHAVRQADLCGRTRATGRRKD